MTSRTSAPVCLICFESEDVSCYLVNCSCHSFCRACFTRYVTIQVSDGNVVIKCPIPHCPAVMTEDEILVSVDHATSKKYQRFKAMKDNPNYVECGRCGQELQFSPAEISDVLCVCGTLTCHKHGISHPGRTCRQYDREVFWQQAASERRIRRSTKKCPACLVSTEMAGGCKYMECSRCKAHWCWRCEKVGPSHHFYHSCSVRGACLIV